MGDAQPRIGARNVIHPHPRPLIFSLEHASHRSSGIMQSFTLSAASPFLFVGTLCVGAATCTCVALVLTRRFRVDAVYTRAHACMSMSWVARSAVSLVSLTLLAIAATWLLGAIDPALYLSPTNATLVYSALLLAMPIHAMAMPTAQSADVAIPRLGESHDTLAESRRAA